ncbi:MAG: DUF1700 domain-containing protein [Clostridia bacterium]|nr:DUF1700 domain-containing protein [Clostridia bacterium]
MNKKEFLECLSRGLSALPKEETEERLNFYSEMIDDRMEEGLSEEEAVAAVGSAEDIAAQIVKESSLENTDNEDFEQKRRLKAWEIALLVIGSPIWLSLGIAALAILVSLYAVIWAVVVSLWAAFASFAACFVGGLAAGTVLLVGGKGISGMAMLGAGLVCAGLAVFGFYASVGATKGTLMLTKKCALWVKERFDRKDGEI